MAKGTDLDGMPKPYPITWKRDGPMLRQWDGSIRFLTGPETIALLLGYKDCYDLRGACRDRRIVQG